MGQLDRGQASRIVYIELKTGYNGDGPACIGRVTFSKSGRSLYYQGRRFERIKGGGAAGNYYEVESGDEYWISGIKQDGRDRHCAGAGKVHVDEDVRDEYERLCQADE
ncbi:MAG: hypothetical protein AAF809_13995 [Bacteroidota bacterium]